MDPERFVVGDHIGNLLDGVTRLVKGTAAAGFFPCRPSESPVICVSEFHTWLARVMTGTTTEALADDGPWGSRTTTAAPDWSLWVEPVRGTGSDGRRDGDAEQAGELLGALTLVVWRPAGELESSELEAIRLFAGLGARTGRSQEQAGEQARRGRLDELVSQISERLMSATLPSLPDALDWTVETLCRFLGAHAAFLRRNDHVAAVSVLMAEYPSRGVPREEDPLGVVPFDADPIFQSPRDFRVPMIVRNPSSADDGYADRVHEGTGAMITMFTGAAVPLVHADVTEGMLAFVYESHVDWTEYEVNALRAVASLLVQLLHRIDAEERLRHSALTDELTGLANRRALLEEVSRRRMSAAKPLALLFLDLDRFKVMNDYLGHGAGDRLLRVIADRIRTSLRPVDFAARLGGDEFVVLLEDTGGALGSVAAAQRLLEIIAQPIDVGGRSVTHTGSIGIAVSESDRMSGEKLLGQADIALYAAKAQGRNRTVVFDETMQASVAHRSDTELQLRKAISDDAFEVYYQPEFDLRTGRILAVEALLRWRREGYGIMGAGDFIPVAEETHLITDIDRWVLEAACNQMAHWRRQFPDAEPMVRVNMSPAQLAVPGVVQTVTGSLERSGLVPGALCLEITEQAMISDVEQAVRTLHDIRRLGVKLAIDDFGTGYTSLAALPQLPLDELKVDMSFVRRSATSPADEAIVQSVRDEKARRRMISTFDLETTEPEWALGYRFDIVLEGRNATPRENHK